MSDDVNGLASKLSSSATRHEAEASPSIESLVAQHHGFVWRVLRGLGLSPADADDATQQVFMIAARKITDIDAARARAFVYGAALRVASNARRGLRRRREVPDDDQADELAPDSRGPEHQIQLTRARELLADVLTQLPDNQRRILILAEIEQLEVPEIAALEGVPVGTAASRLRVARQKFRELLEASRHKNPFFEPA